MRTNDRIKKYLDNKRRIAVLETDLDSLDKLSSVVRVTNYEEEGGRGEGLEARCIRMIDKRLDIELELAILRAENAKVDKALAIMKEECNFLYNMLDLRHIKKKSLTAIEIECGYSRKSVLGRIREAEKEFEKLTA